MEKSKPLWQVMADARGEQWPALHRHGYAAEIRALAYWLAPLEPCTGPLAAIASIEIPEITAIRTCLLDEANRADAVG